MKKQEQIEAELRNALKSARKSIFVKLSLTNLIENSRRMFVIYNSYKSGEKFKLNNNDETLEYLNNINSDFDSLANKIKKIPKPIKDLLNRKWEKEPNTEESVYGTSEIILKKLIVLKKIYNNLNNTLIKDFKSGVILNVDPIPIAIIHSSMVMWVEVLKNKPPSKQNPKINKYLLSFFHEVFDAFDCKEDIKTSFYNWNNAKNMFS
tara:strand:- start:1622 stop:2242 length:621 start_codon:yes stop_codon:yes gene_type:complete